MRAYAAGSATILAEVALAQAGGDAGVRNLLHLDDLRATIGEIAGFLADSVHAAMPVAPQTYSVEFGLKLAVDTGGLTSILARVGAEATAVIRLEWSGAARAE